MPSKGKKNVKSQSRLSTPEVASPRTPPHTSDRDSDVISDEELVLLCEEASRIFPSFIGKSAFVGHVVPVDLKSKGCHVWLSNSSMVSSSLAPGSIVSVSIAASRKNSVDSGSFPLKSLTKECAGCYGLDTRNTSIDGAGNYFALATVYPSSKVLKNGVHISPELSYTMGCPSFGTHIFIYPVQNQCLPSLLYGKNELHSIGGSIGDNSLLVHNCNELYLELAPLKNGLPVKISNISLKDSSAAKSYLQFGNENIASPKTPNGLKLSSLSDLSSPVSEDCSSGVPNQKSQSTISYDIREQLGDESSKNLLQTCAASWLYSRWLLVGNIVSLRILSELHIFQVIGPKRMPVERSSPDSSSETSLSCPGGSNTSEFMNHAIVVNQKTKVSLSLPPNVTSDELIQRDLSKVELREKGTVANVPNNISKLGGLSKEYAVLKDIILSSVKNDLLSNFGLRTTKGVLLHGPPGTGKTSLAQLCAHDVGVNIFRINGAEVIGQYYGESEQALHEVFDSAIQAAPAVVFIDELDAIAPARKDGGDGLSQRMVATLLNLMDGVCRTEGLLVIAATNRPDNIEPALRRPGRFDREIEIGVPSPHQRLDMLVTVLSDVDHTLSELQIEHLATVTHGFVGADLVALCKEAGLVCLRRYLNFKKDWHNVCSSQYRDQQRALLKGAQDLSDHSDDSTSCVSELSVTSNSLLPSCTIGSTSDDIEIVHDSGEDTTTNSGEDINLKVTYEDFQKAKMIIRPSAMREVILEVPKVKWEDVGGQNDVKAQLMEAVEWPQKHCDALNRIGTHPPKGVLMFGPPGCSKTLMARAVASEAALNFLAVKGPELFSKWVGESEKAVRSLFAKARANAPSIVFFDEIDGLAVTRGKESDGVSVTDRVMSQLLVELDGLHERANVTVIAATNRPDKIDPALLRPGRFDRLLYVGPPNEMDREEIFRIHLRKIPCDSDVSLKELASLTDGCTGADISLICREAAVGAIEESLDASAITMKHLKSAIKQVQPTEIQSYQQLTAKFQRAVGTCDVEDEGNSMQCSSRSTWPSIGEFIKSVKLFFYRISVSIFI